PGGWWRSGPGRRTRSPRRMPGRASAAAHAGGRARAGAEARSRSARTAPGRIPVRSPPRARARGRRREASSPLLPTDAHRPRERRAEHLHLVTDADRERAVERLTFDDLEPGARRDPTLGEEAEHLRIG